jgi:hypothetical protein
MAYPRGVHQPKLKLADPHGSRSNRLDSDLKSAPIELQQLAADRLVTFLNDWTKKQQFGRPIRVLDHSGTQTELLDSILKSAKAMDLRLDITAVAESAVAAELLNGSLDKQSHFTISQGSLGDTLTSKSYAPFDCVHSALNLAHLRDLPMLTTLGKLERSMTPCFVWTDHAKLLSRKQVKSLATRLDLGFCSYKKPIGSKLFTLAGTRRI